MPLHAYRCLSCHSYEEELFSIREEVPLSMLCPCGDQAPRQLPRIAITPGRWGDQTGKYGVNGFFDRGLGVTYHNSKQRDAAIKAAGVAPLSDYPAHFWEDQTAKQNAEAERRNEFAANYAATVKKFDGDEIKATTELMPAKECLAGTFDDIY